MELSRHRSVRFEEYARLHQGGKRSLQRDLQQLRTIGKSAGFTISGIENGELVRLTALDSRIRRLDGARAPLLRLIAEDLDKYLLLGEKRTPPIGDERIAHLADVLSERI